MQKVRVSIIMGIYNCANTLCEAIDSLYCQTFKDFILIMCDDASTDNTYEIAKQYTQKYNNIILLKNKENLKLAGTLNKCLARVNTEYIARMDGDDISLPTRLEKEINFLDNHAEYAVVSCPMIHFDEKGDWGHGRAVERPNKDTFKSGTPHPHAPCMARTQVIKEVGGYTDSQRTIRGQDYYLWYKVYKAGYTGYNLQEHLYKMRDDQNAISRRTLKNRYKEFVIKTEILKGLGFKFAWAYALPTLAKAFIPNDIMRKIRDFKMKKTINQLQ